MAAANQTGIRGLARLLRLLLSEHRQLEVQGLGEFHSSPDGQFCFGGDHRPGVFISYASEDRRTAIRLSDRLNQSGFSAWIDRRRLRPGDSWQRTIESAIDSSDFFLACLSRNSLRKRGTFQRELRMAIDCARNVPLDETYFIPLRLDDCAVPRAISSEWQHIDLFPDFETGVRSLIASMKQQWSARREQ